MKCCSFGNAVLVESRSTVSTVFTKYEAVFNTDKNKFFYTIEIIHVSICPCCSLLQCYGMKDFPYAPGFCCLPLCGNSPCQRMSTSVKAELNRDGNWHTSEIHCTAYTVCSHASQSSRSFGGHTPRFMPACNDPPRSWLKSYLRALRCTTRKIISIL